MSTEEQRLTYALDVLADRTAQLEAFVLDVHPRPECLPLPLLQNPRNSADLTQVVDKVADNLFAGSGSRARPWVEARSSCPHLPERDVLNLFELLYKWYQLLAAAKEHVTVAGGRNRLHDLQEVAVQFDAVLSTLSARVTAEKWFVCDMDDGVLRAEPTRMAAVKWWIQLNCTERVIARHTYAPGYYDYVVGQNDYDSADAAIVRADRMDHYGGDLAQVPLYPIRDEPFERVERAPVDDASGS